MDLLVVLRGLTLGARLLLVAAAWRAIAHVRERAAGPERLVWITLAGQYAVLAMTTAAVEVDWLLHNLLPAARRAAIYNPTYLLNATVTAATPWLVAAWLASLAIARRLAQVMVGGIVAMAVLALVTGAGQDWATLMAWTQVLSFVEIGGYLTFGGLILLGHAGRVNPYVMGLLAAAGLFAVVVPIQAEFFELVGQDHAGKIWHLNQALQLLKVSVELLIVLAYMNSMVPRQRASHEPQRIGLRH